MTLSIVMVNRLKVLVTLLPVLSLFFPATAGAQVLCDVDGVKVEFKRERGGVLELKDVKPKEIVGRANGDSEFSLGHAGNHTATSIGGVLQVNSLNPRNFPDHGLSVSGFDRIEKNVWEVEFPRGLYEFRNKNDLVVEISATVTGGLASHVSGSPSAVSLVVEEGGTHEVWWGGGNSLRLLQGDLTFYYSNLLSLGLEGVHRATLDLCVNIRGHL